MREFKATFRDASCASEFVACAEITSLLSHHHQVDDIVTFRPAHEDDVATFRVVLEQTRDRGDLQAYTTKEVSNAVD